MSVKSSAAGGVYPSGSVISLVINFSAPVNATEAGEMGDNSGDHLIPIEVQALLRETGISGGVGRTCHIHDSLRVSCIRDGSSGNFGNVTLLVTSPTIKVSIVHEVKTAKGGSIL